MNKITNYQVVNLGVIHPDYFSGFGTTSEFNHAVYGIGDSSKEAFLDALEQLYSSYDAEINPELDSDEELFSEESLAEYYEKTMKRNLKDYAIHGWFDYTLDNFESKQLEKLRNMYDYDEIDEYIEELTEEYMQENNMPYYHIGILFNMENDSENY